jgi:hypothetical protein
MAWRSSSRRRRASPTGDADAQSLNWLAAKVRILKGKVSAISARLLDDQHRSDTQAAPSFVASSSSLASTGGSLNNGINCLVNETGCDSYTTTQELGSPFYSYIGDKVDIATRTDLVSQFSADEVTHLDIGRAAAGYFVFPVPRSAFFLSGLGLPTPSAQAYFRGSIRGELESESATLLQRWWRSSVSELEAKQFPERSPDPGNEAEELDALRDKVGDNEMEMDPISLAYEALLEHVKVLTDHAHDQIDIVQAAALDFECPGMIAKQPVDSDDMQVRDLIYIRNSRRMCGPIAHTSSRFRVFCAAASRSIDWLQIGSSVDFIQQVQWDDDELEALFDDMVMNDRPLSGLAIGYDSFVDGVVGCTQSPD